MPYVYILRSQKNGRFYVGSTNNLERRLREHNEGHSKYTRGVLPLKLVFRQGFGTIIEARAVESRLKKFKSKEILGRIIKDGKIQLARG